MNLNFARIRVKMCGMTRSEDVSHAVSLGVDALGFIFYSKSPRFVTQERAKDLIKNLPPFVDAVAVLVNPDKDFVFELLSELPIQVLQFHGDESPAFCEQFKKPYLKAIHTKNGEQIQDAMKTYPGAQALVLDTPSSTAQGGTGLSFDWDVIPKDLPKPFILSGGLNKDNVVTAVSTCKPYAVDVCSGIEQSPGVKDRRKMTDFISALWD